MKEKFKLHMPHVYTLIFMLIVLVSIMTWVIPSGAFEREVVNTSAGERSVAIAGTYHVVDKVDSEGTDLRQGIQAILQAPGKGIQAAVEVLAFVFIIGGVFQIMAKTNALNLGMRSVVKRLGKKEILIIPILMVLFGLGGSTFGMSDELVPFYLLIMPIMFAMGYDSVTTFMVVCVGASTGYAASTINPFNVLIAQGIAGIQGNPQLVFRMIQWVVMMTIVIAFVTIRALKIKKNPQASIMYEADLKKRQELMTAEPDNVDFNIRHKLVIAVFVAAPYTTMMFMPTGGINAKNINTYLAFPKVLACGGSWMVSGDLVKAGAFDEITALTKEALMMMLGFELKHVGINCENEKEADITAGTFASIFGFEKKTGTSSIFVGSVVEAMKAPYLGAKGHIAIGTNSVERAVNYLETQGVIFDRDTAKYKENQLISVYMKQEIGGFAVHLVQK